MEFAFVAPVLFILILGAIEYGLIMHVSSLIEHAAHEGARKGITGAVYGGTDRVNAIEAEIRKQAGPWLTDPTQLTVETSTFAKISDIGLNGQRPKGNKGYGNATEAVVYYITYNWQVLTPVFGSIIGTDGFYAIRSTVVVQNEDFAPKKKGPGG